jgi:hypothetical protein
MQTEKRIGWIKNLPEVGFTFTGRRLAAAEQIDTDIASHLAAIRRLRKDASKLANGTYAAALATWTKDEVKATMDAYIKAGLK